MNIGKLKLHNFENYVVMIVYALAPKTAFTPAPSYVGITKVQYLHRKSPPPPSPSKLLQLERETIAGTDGVVVAPPVLAEVLVVWLAPGLGVERAVSSVRDVVLA